jgi:hypothetical protein
MKALLFLTNIVFLSFVPSTCHHQQKQVDDTVRVDSNSIVPPPAVTDSMTAIADSTKVKYSGNNLDSISKDDKYSNGTGQIHEAPKHDSPDQMKLDSIKAAKAKKKKG